MAKSSNNSSTKKLSGRSLAQAIKAQMGSEYHGVFPPYFAIAAMAFLAAMASSFLILLICGMVWFGESQLMMLAMTAVLFVVMSLMLKPIQGQASLTSITWLQGYAVVCTTAGLIWAAVSYFLLHSQLFTVLALLASLAGLVATLLFKTRGFKELVRYQIKVRRIMLDCTARNEKQL
ncbi:hypothetical protein [Alkalimonas mucilaginosa]|uniref:Uncharacterized protein n=1 Tax=Alkalimonas mucilaginosa TaxID=3057676 RepID=A0ABU7JDN3_9GAMM|nr:hypothetical protein [Alkalimonas sp. MEB004]MEE2023803.1 hypothetical protein [Alkalimonas sp. MEB004]